jgi:uncharacterized membrane protein YqjE
MAQQDIQSRLRSDGDGTGVQRNAFREQHDDASLGELLKRLSSDSGELISQEIALAKAELRESTTNVVKGAAKLLVAYMLGFVGLIALTAFAVVGLGDATNGKYWLWALVIGAVELIVAGVLAKSAKGSMDSGGIKPTETIETLQEDKNWAGREMRDLKQDITGNRKTQRV